MPDVTVVIATRDRPRTLARLLAAVRSQDLAELECIVIDDGSSAATRSAYGAIWDRLDSRFRLHSIGGCGRGSGPGGARNRGIELAGGEFVAFCDDDDTWIRTDHLSAAVRTMREYRADVFFADMQTVAGGAIRNPHWYAIGKRYLERRLLAPELRVYDVLPRDAAGFLNHGMISADTLVVRRSLLVEIGMYWEQIHFAEDHDFALRLVDRARRILFRSVVVGECDVSPHESACRRLSEEERCMFSMLAALHAEAAVASAAVRRVARGNRAWRLLGIGRSRLAAGSRRTALSLAWQSLKLRFTLAGLRLFLEALVNA